MAESIPVPVAVACRCPGTPHDGDSVYLRPKLSLRGGIVAQQVVMTADPDVGIVTAGLLDAFLRHEVVAWTYVDDKGEALPVTQDNIERLLLSDFTYATPIADAAAELYTDSVINPLRVAVSRSSQPSHANGSTSRRKASSSKRRKQSKQSSTTTTPTAVIENPSE